MHRKLTRLSLLLIITLALGCGAHYQIHPGSIPVAGDQGAFDSHTADTLSDLNAFITEAEKHTADYNDLVKALLVQARAKYTAAKQVYLAWRQIQTEENLAAAKAAVADAQSATNQFTTARNADSKAKGGK